MVNEEGGIEHAEEFSPLPGREMGAAANWCHRCERVWPVAVRSSWHHGVMRWGRWLGCIQTVVVSFLAIQGSVLELPAGSADSKR